MANKKLILDVSEDMKTAIKTVAKRAGATQASITRIALAKYLESQGQKGDWDVESPGGYRRDG